MARDLLTAAAESDPGGAARLAVPGLERFPAGGLKLTDLRRDRARARKGAAPEPDL